MHTYTYRKFPLLSRVDKHDKHQGLKQCTILYYTILYYTILYYYYTILLLYYAILSLYYAITILYYTILFYTILQHTPWRTTEFIDM